MATASSILKAVTLIVVGGAVGAGLTHFLDQRKARLNFMGSTYIQSRRLMNQIDLFDRQAMPELRNNLQMYLDYDICILGNFASRQDQAAALAKSNLGQIRDHRKSHPYQSPSPETQGRVNLALSLAD